MRDPVDVHVGQRLRQLRRDRKLSLEIVAEAIGVTYQQVQKYENAANRVSASQLWRFAAYFKVDVATLFPNAGLENADRELIERLESLPEKLRSTIGDLANAIADAERQASRPSDPPSSDPV